MEKKFDEGLRI